MYQIDRFKTILNKVNDNPNIQLKKIIQEIKQYDELYVILDLTTGRDCDGNLIENINNTAMAQEIETFEPYIQEKDKKKNICFYHSLYMAAFYAESKKITTENRVPFIAKLNYRQSVRLVHGLLLEKKVTHVSIDNLIMSTAKNYVALSNIDFNKTIGADWAKDCRVCWSNECIVWGRTYYDYLLTPSILNWIEFREAMRCMIHELNFEYESILDSVAIMGMMRPALFLVGDFEDKVSAENIEGPENDSIAVFFEKELAIAYAESLGKGITMINPENWEYVLNDLAGNVFEKIFIDYDPNRNDNLFLVKPNIEKE